MSKQLKVLKQANEVAVLVDGSTLISQNKLARLLNVKRSTLSMRIGKQNYNSSNGLDEKTAFSLATYYAYESKVCTQEAKDFLAKLGEGGMRAYNYSQAGYKFNATPQIPTALELAKQTVRLLEQVEAQKEQIKDDAILTAKSDKYFPVSHVKKLNPALKIHAPYLSKTSQELGYPIKQLFSNYDTVIINTYHYDVWIKLYPNIKL